MKIEHIACNVANPEEISQWYIKNLGMTMRNRIGESLFLQDELGSVVLELYCNPSEQVPDYFTMNPLNLHIAFYSEDLEQDNERLIQAGATSVDEKLTDGGAYGWYMLQDPWGMSIQIIRRKKPL